MAYDPAQIVDLPVVGAATFRPPAPDTLHLLSWNVGYAGLGRESDFVFDGGRHLRTGSRSTVVRNLDAIVDRLRAENADVLLLQELARDSYVTHAVDVLAGVREAMTDYQLAFAPTIRVMGLPVIRNLEVGQGTLARPAILRAVRHAMRSPKRRLGVTVQHFNVLASRLAGGGQDGDEGGEWVIFNAHLPAFDEGSLRRVQLIDVLGLMQAEYEAGNYVVAGGDWNLRLAATTFPHEPNEKSTFWVRDLPPDVTPPGWRWAVDASTPTNRTLDQPYRPGVNYASVIDGFLVSPNVEVLAVETLDLHFANSDHNPVRARVRRK